MRQLFRFIQQNGCVLKGRELLAVLPGHVRGETLDINWYTGRRPTLKAWQDDLPPMGTIQMDWPAVAGPPERLATSALQRALAGGARLSLRAGRPSSFPADLKPYTVRYPAARTPLTAIDRRIFWYGCPWPDDGRVDYISVRVNGERVCRTLMYFLEMNMRKEFCSGHYAGLKAYVENRFTCPACRCVFQVRDLL